MVNPQMDLFTTCMWRMSKQIELVSSHLSLFAARFPRLNLPCTKYQQQIQHIDPEHLERQWND